MNIDLDTLVLAKGAHGKRGDGLCLLEAVAWFAGQPHTDRPPCVSPVLGTYGRALNDVLPDEARQSLKPYIPALPGTAGDGKDATRGYIALDWLIRTWTPAWLDLASLTGEARALRDLRRIADRAAAQSAGPVVRQASEKAAAARDAARDATRDAARDAAWDATWDAARDAAWAAAWAAARDAAWDATWDAARDAAWAAAWAAAWDAAWDATWDAARAELAPTVTQLQESAIGLFAALIAGEWPS